jgi:hypothetical protein
MLTTDFQDWSVQQAMHQTEWYHGRVASKLEGSVWWNKKANLKGGREEYGSLQGQTDGHEVE